MTTSVEFGFALPVEGFDRDHVPYFTFRRTMETVPRIGEDVAFTVDLADGTQATAYARVDEVVWLEETEATDAGIYGKIREATDGYDDLTPEKLAERMGLPREKVA